MINFLNLHLHHQNDKSQSNSFFKHGLDLNIRRNWIILIFLELVHWTQSTFGKTIQMETFKPQASTNFLNSKLAFNQNYDYGTIYYFLEQIKTLLNRPSKKRKRVVEIKEEKKNFPFESLKETLSWESIGKNRKRQDMKKFYLSFTQTCFNRKYQKKEEETKTEREWEWDPIFPAGEDTSRLKSNYYMPFPQKEEKKSFLYEPDTEDISNLFQNYLKDLNINKLKLPPVLAPSTPYQPQNQTFRFSPNRRRIDYLYYLIDKLEKEIKQIKDTKSNEREVYEELRKRILPEKIKSLLPKSLQQFRNTRQENNNLMNNIFQYQEKDSALPLSKYQKVSFEYTIFTSKDQDALLKFINLISKTNQYDQYCTRILNPQTFYEMCPEERKLYFEKTRTHTRPEPMETIPLNYFKQLTEAATKYKQAAEQYILMFRFVNEEW